MSFIIIAAVFALGALYFVQNYKQCLADGRKMYECRAIIEGGRYLPTK
jgi:hypothetical protein